MRRLLPILLLGGALAVMVALQMQHSGSRAGFEAPGFSLPDLDGVTHDLASYRGKVVFLNVWATWCPPCREEMPSMNRLHERYAREGLVVLAVSQDEGPKEGVEAFARGLGLTFPILLDPEGVVPPRFGVTGYPETFLIDRAGRIVRHVVGPADWFSDGARAEIEALLRAPAANPDA
jgi:peroxiredoxin